MRGGRWHLRNALYMPAQSAIQHNPDLKPFYDRRHPQPGSPRAFGSRSFAPHRLLAG
ncbi:MAG: transposase [Hyphomicrobiales bacterium]|nr:transposase [Hyphomicrobiales bacterium]MBV8440276.1 transposase [Hyphomicrobiales bacterium]